MFMIDYKDISWWYWLATAILLTLGLAGYTTSYVLAIDLVLWQLLHFSIRDRSLTSFSVQVRFWYLVLLLVAFPESTQVLYWVPTIGTWAQIFFGYCAMARLVALFPRNRNEPLTYGLVIRSFFSRPVRGNILQGFC
jgi:hypothetical protein